MVSTISVVSSSLAFYTLFYASYDEESRKYSLKRLGNIFTGREGVDRLAIQLNKVVPLSSLTQLAFTFLPGASKVVDCEQLRLITTGMLAAHVTFSLFRYYGTDKIPRIEGPVQIYRKLVSNDKVENMLFKRHIALALGGTAITILALWFLNIQPYGLTPAKGGSIVAFLATLHYYFMEVDSNGNFPRRPFGLVAFFSGLLCGIIGILELIN